MKNFDDYERFGYYNIKTISYFCSLTLRDF